MSDRTRALKKNTVLSLVFELTTILCGFILPKFILQQYGSATNGLVSSITNFLGFISLCEMGVGAVVKASLYRPLAQKDMGQASAVVASSQKFYRVIAGLLLAYVAVLVVFYPQLVENFGFWFTASLVVVLSLNTFARYYFGISYMLLLVADQKEYITFSINIATLIASTALSILLICLEMPIHLVMCVSSCVFIMRPIGVMLYVKRHYALDLKVKFEGEPIRQKWNGMAQHIATTVQEKADTVILTLLCTLESVSVYGVYFMVINGIKGLIFSFTPGISAMMGNMLAKEETRALKKTFAGFEWAMHTLATLLFSATAVLVVPFVRVYTENLSDKAIYVQPAFGAIMSAALAARCMQMPYDVVVQAAGHFKQTQKSAIIEPILNVVISVAAVARFGLVGVAVGTLISMAYRVFYLAIYLMKHILHNNPLGFVKQLAVDAVTAALIVLATLWLKLPSVSYGSWILMALAVCAIAAAVSLAVNALCYRKTVLGIVKQCIGRRAEK